MHLSLTHLKTLASYSLTNMTDLHIDLEEREPLPEPLRPPEIDPPLPDGAQREADGEEASLVQQRHRGDGAQLNLQSVNHISLENISL